MRIYYLLHGSRIYILHSVLPRAKPKARRHRRRGWHGRELITVRPVSGVESWSARMVAYRTLINMGWMGPGPEDCILDEFMPKTDTQGLGFTERTSAPKENDDMLPATISALEPNDLIPLD